MFSSFQVVDGPGVGDSRLDLEDASTRLSRSVQQALTITARGYHALLLVLRYGSRFTAEDQDTLEFLERLLGENFISDHCVVVMTCGDQFEKDAGGSGDSFDAWCRRQEGGFQNLLDQCGRRIVLFDNTTESQERRDAQLDMLLAVVDSLKKHGRRYTAENFERAKAARDASEARFEGTMLNEDVMQETGLILHSLQKIKGNLQGEDQIEHLQECLERSEDILGHMQGERRTGCAEAQCFLLALSAMRSWICEVIRCLSIEATERRRMEASGSETTDQRTNREHDAMAAVDRLRKSLGEYLQDLETAYRELKVIKQRTVGWLERLGWYVVILCTSPILPIACLFKTGRYCMRRALQRLD